MKHILAILHKEWLELRQERTLIWSTLLPPLLLTLVPLVVLYGVGQTPDEDVRELGATLADPALAGMNTLELGQAIIGRSLSVFSLLMPVIIPGVIAAYSIIGEKTSRTLEPLLATPVSTGELLAAKSLAAAIPAMALTWLCAALFAGGVALLAASARVFGAIISPAWLLGLLFCTPALALLTIAATVAISSRVSDPRSAQQFSGVIVVPLIGLVFGQLSGLLVLSPLVALAAAVVLWLLAALALWVAVRLFQRETILTKWT
jgi:ABC-2 type transport system permease protein